MAHFLESAMGVECLLSENSIVFVKGLTFVDNDGEVTRVPPEYVSDGSTIRWYARPFCGHNLDRKNRRAGHLHDYCVSPSPITGRLPMTREKAARKYYRALRADGKYIHTAFIQWLFVYVDAVIRRHKEVRK